MKRNQNLWLSYMLQIYKNILTFASNYKENMRKIVYLLKTYPFSWLCIVVIWILCFCTTPHTPLDNVPLMDKWTHFIMYGGTCSVIWIENMRAGKVTGRLPRMFLWAWLIPILMSGLIEILQANCTGGRRSGDWMDFLANSIGATLALLIWLAIYKKAPKRKA